MLADPAEPPATVPQLVGILEGTIPVLGSRDEADGAALDGVFTCIEGLGVYGIDGEALVRAALARKLAFMIVAAVLFGEDEEGRSLPISREWRTLLAPSSSGDVVAQLLDRRSSATAEEFEALKGDIARMLPPVVAWANEAPFTDLIMLRPPDQDDFARYRVQSRPVSPSDVQYVWLWERSTLEVGLWATSSLHAEYRYSRLRDAIPFADAALRDMAVDRSVLVEEIALRAVRGGVDDAGDASMYSAVFDEASRNLRAGQYREAAALFEFYVRSHPASAQAMNDLGFCLLPVSVEDSLHRLEQAARLSYQPRCINIHNQMNCLVALAREREALDRAEYFWQRDQDSGVAAVLWSHNGNEWQLVTHVNPLLAVAELARDIAISLGLAERAEVWSQRVVEIAS